MESKIIFRNTFLGNTEDVSINDYDMPSLQVGNMNNYAHTSMLELLSQDRLEIIQEKDDISIAVVKGSLVVILKYGESTIYVIGTNHASVASRHAVIDLIRKVKPHVVMNEHDDTREGLTDSKIFNSARNFNFELLYDAIAETGFLAGIIWFALAYQERLITVLFNVPFGGDMSAPRSLEYEMQVTSQNLLTAPRQRLGRKKNFDIVFGDRPILITLKRMGSALNFFRRAFVILCVTLSTFFGYRPGLYQIYGILSSSGNFNKVIVDERDLYLTYSLQQAAKRKYDEPTRVVGIVGAAHVYGIIMNWGKVTKEQVEEITRV